MNNDFQAPPPPYSDIQNKVNPNVGAASYQPVAPGPGGPMGYPPVHQTIPVAYTIQAVPLGAFSRHPVQCTCSHCGAVIVTRIEENSGLLAWLLCVLLVVFGCWLGCCLIPFCVSDLQNIKHYCPNCKAFLAEYRPL